jgi:hypothetical protein
MTKAGKLSLRQSHCSRLDCRRAKKTQLNSKCRISHDLRRARLAKNQPAEITMFQISEVQESPAFTGRDVLP